MAERGYDSAVSRAAARATVDTAGTESAAAIPRAVIAFVVAVIIGASAAALLRSTTPPDDGASASTVADGGVAVLFGASGAAETARAGALAPELSWVTPQGDIQGLAALRGRPVVLNFWATWCVPCRTELPEFDAVAAENPDVTILALDLQEDATTVKAYVERLQLRALMPVLDSDGAAARRYGVVGLPTTFFIDPDGVIRHVEIGGTLTREHLRSDLLELQAR